MQCIMGCVLKSPKLPLLALIFLFSKLAFAEVANASTNSELRTPSEAPHHLTSADVDDGKQQWSESQEPSSTLNFPTQFTEEVNSAPNIPTQFNEEENSTLNYEPRINDSVVDDFLKVLESQQVAVVADAELVPEESHGAEYGHHKGHKTGFHKGTAHKAEKGHVDETGSKGVHKESHDGSHKKGHHKEAGTKYKGQEHKHQHFLKEADGSKGLKGHSVHSKGHHNKGNKANGHKNIWHKEESGRSRKFFDDYEHKKYHSKHDELNLHHKAKDHTDYHGGVIKAKKHHDSYGKKASLDEGKHHDSKKKVANSYGHKGHFDEHKGYNKKGEHKAAHADGHGGHGGGHGHHGAYSVQKPVKTTFTDSKDAKYLGSHSQSVPTNAKMTNKYGDISNAIPISLFVKKEETGKGRKPASKVKQGNYTGYLENSEPKGVEGATDPEETNEISDSEETNQKFKLKRTKKVKTKVSKPLMIKKPFLIPESENDEDLKSNISMEEREDERPRPNPESLIDIPLLQGEKTQQISIITRAELNPAASGGGGKGYSKTKGHKDSHIKASGEKGEKGGKKVTGFKGHHVGDHHEKHHSDFVDKGAKDFNAHDHKKKFAGAHHTGKKGSKGHSHGSKGHHHKGHNDKGFKNVHHKVEYTVKKDFYHDNEDKLHHSKVDDFDTYFAKKRKQNLNDHEFYGKNIDDHYGFKGHHDQGHHHSNHKGHSKHYGHKGHHDHHHADGHKDHHKKGHGAEHHHHDHHGHHSHVDYDYLPYR